MMYAGNTLILVNNKHSKFKYVKFPQLGISGDQNSSHADPDLHRAHPELVRASLIQPIIAIHILHELLFHRTPSYLSQPIQIVITAGIFIMMLIMMWQTFPLRYGLVARLFKEFKWTFFIVLGFICKLSLT